MRISDFTIRRWESQSWESARKSAPLEFVFAEVAVNCIHVA